MFSDLRAELERGAVVLEAQGTSITQILGGRGQRLWLKWIHRLFILSLTACPEEVLDSDAGAHLDASQRAGVHQLFAQVPWRINSLIFQLLGSEAQDADEPASPDVQNFG